MITNGLGVLFAVFVRSRDDTFRTRFVVAVNFQAFDNVFAIVWPLATLATKPNRHFRG